MLSQSKRFFNSAFRCLSLKFKYFRLSLLATGQSKDKEKKR